MRTYKLKQLLSIKNGRDHKELNSGNIPVYGSGGIMRYGDKAMYNDESILLPRKGTLANIQYVNKPFWTVDTIYYSIVNKELANPFYLFNFLKVLDLSKLNTGTGVPSMTFDSYYNLDIILPELEVQQKIASVLSALDSKIELNNRINAELEAMAKTIYDYWFVQFEFPCLPENYKFSGAGKPTNFESCFTYRQVGGLPVPDGKKWFVYVLLCEDGSFYKGMTNDLYRRYYEHHTGQGAEHTKDHQPQKVIHWEIFSSQSEAATREKELKTGFGRTWLQREYEYLINHKPGLPAHQNARPSKLMPAGKMVWNEELKREIPEGWEVKKLTEEMDLQYGFPFSTELFNDDGIGVPIIRIRDILNCSISNYSTEEVDDKYRINKGDIIVGMDGNFHINYWNRDNCYLNQRSLRIRSYNESISEIQARYSIEPFIQAREKNVSRTTVAHLSAKDINDLKILKADNEFQIKANTCFNSNLEKIVSNRIQNHKLTELRNWLLPMLMNGQVKVSER